MVVKVAGVVWLVSVFVRFLWLFYPQIGYIHPDEFFQSPEIIASDVFGFQILRTWEFKGSFPIRSVLLPSLCTGIPFKVLQWLHNSGIFSWDVNSWELLVSSRILYCCLSLVIDISVYKISLILKLDPASTLGVVGTSYVTLVFNTRSFSNSLESVLFALLLWILANHLSSRENTSPQARLRNMELGMVVVAGMWNRPTFLAYSLIPLIGWCCKFYKDSQTWMLLVVKEGFIVAMGSIFGVALFVTTDSVYFGCLTITPFNFIKYNLDTSHLKEHGLHPRYTHLLVNMPLMFGVLAILYYTYIIMSMAFMKNYIPLHVKCTEFQGKREGENKKNSAILGSNMLISKLLVLSTIVPVVILSMIPHQEPRFLIPLLTPLAILFGHVILGSNQSSLATASWFIWNIIGCLMFGILHQGGIYPSLQYLQGSLNTAALSSSNTTYHVVFSNTYMPPRYLLAWPTCGESDKCAITNKVIVHDLGGQTKGDLTSWLDRLIQREKTSNSTHEIFLVCPSTVYFKHLQFLEVKEFFPHLTMEDPPNLGSLFDARNSCNKTSSSKASLFSEISNWEFLTSWLQSNLSLRLYRYEQ